MYGEFFEGEVVFVTQGFFRATYCLLDDPTTLIAVKNGTHVRKIFDQFGRFPPSFEIIAPMASVRVKRGQIPSNYIKYLDHSYYINLRQQYLGH